MFNINFRDDHPEISDINFQSWHALPAQQQQSIPRPHLQQQQSIPRPHPQQQQHRPQPIPQQPLPQQQPQHGHRVISKQLQQPQQQQQPPQQQPSLVPVRERLWVEISDDEDSILGNSTPFKSDGKSQQTPPLDLTTMERTKLGSRHIESPLDLSVKPRKRVADTSDYMEFTHSQGHHGDASMAKRMYMASHSISPSSAQQSYSTKERHSIMTGPVHLSQQKQYNMSESMMKAKYLQPKQQHVNSKHSPRRLSPLSNPLTATQQQYVSLQRQHQMQQLQQSQQLRMRQQPMSVSPGQYTSSQEGLRSATSSQQQKQHYPSMTNSHPGSAQSPMSHTSETVALQGFFEPTQRLTVNTVGLNRSNYKLGSQPARSDQSAYLGGHSPALHPNVSRQKELTSLDDPRSQIVAMSQFSPGMTSATASISRMDLGGRSSAGMPPMEMLQQRQLQRQRQMQVQREQSVVIPSVSSVVSHGSMGQLVHQERAAMSQMYDMQKQRSTEQAVLLPKVPFPPHQQEQVSPYSQQKMQQKFMLNSSSQSAIHQEERKLYSSSARYSIANQPVSMLELQKSAVALVDKTQINKSHNSGLSQINRNPETNISMLQSKKRIPSDSAILDSRQRSRHHEQERKYRMSVSEGMERSYSDSMDHQMSAVRRDIHPSVIQKPQGFIPPRIVSGSGRASTSGGNGEQKKSVSDISQGRYGRGETRPVAAADKASIDSLYRRNSSDSVQRSVHNDTKHMSHIRDDSSVHRNMVPRQHYSSSINNYNRDLNNTNSQMYQQSKLHNKTEQKGVSSHEKRLSSRSNDSQTVKTIRSDQVNSERFQRIENNKKFNEAQNMASALSGMMIPQVPQTSDERSITKGTSGMKKDTTTVDLFSHLVLRELKKGEEASSVNPFANRSILQEFDRSKNTCTVSKSEQTDESSSQQNFLEQQIKGDSQMSNDSSLFEYPLQIAIPGNRSSSSGNGGQIADAKQSDMRVKSPKILSRKQMILRAFKQDEDMKNTVNIDKDQKIPMESHKFASSKRSEKELSSQSNFPPSPKMPILSPQERNRTTPIVSPGMGGDPPNLEATPVSGANHTTALCSNQSKTASEMNSFEEHLHKLISDAVKGSVNKDKDSVYETVCRELTTQPQGKVFITRQLSQNKNIPVANVAPIVHGRNIPESGSGKQETLIKSHVELDEEDKKLAAVVTRSLFDSSYNLQLAEKNRPDEKTDMKIDPHITVAHAVVDNEFNKSKMDDSLFDEDSNAAKRMSPGLKKLMLYRHRDLAENSGDCHTPVTDSDQSLSQMSDAKPTLQAGSTKESHKEVEPERNVFGTFNEILAQKCGGKTETEFSTATWSEVKMEDEELDIQMVPNTDYDGDDDEDTKDLKRLPRRSRKSSVKQQADRLIKKARHRRQSEGMCRTQFSRQRSSMHKGFIDFTPQVLPHRTRIKLKGKSPTRKCRDKRDSLSPIKQKGRSSSRETKSTSLGKTRQRRSSSLDRDTKRKHNNRKSKQICYSDNEIENVDSHVTNDVIGDNWHDESTDEDYFQNYQDEFKQQTQSITPCENSPDSPITIPAKKVNPTKKRKGFHFKQKYIFQRKRKPKNKAKVIAQDQITAGNLDENFNFNDEVQSYSPIPYGHAEIGFYDNIPIPPDVKRLAVNKDTGETLLHRAARMGHEEVALYCLATGSVDVNARDNAGYTALHECCVRGQQEIARILLMHGADVNCCSVDGIRPIHDAVEIDQIEMVRLLLSFGADPTLSTYAGRSLLKIARSERMKKFLHDYHSDLNGHESDREESSWNFEASNTHLEPEDKKGCLIFNELPSDPEDESEDLCTLSAKPLYVNRRLAPEHGKRVEDYVLLHDILNSYNISRKEFDGLGISGHLIKRLSVQNLQETLADSMFTEFFMKKEEEESSVPALRAVDASQVMSKLEKHLHSASKRLKS